jgi:hypothetical protein
MVVPAQPFALVFMDLLAKRLQILKNIRDWYLNQLQRFGRNYHGNAGLRLLEMFQPLQTPH